MTTVNNLKNGLPDAFEALEQGVHAALQTYSNVHRGSGHNSIVSTALYEQAREIVLEYLNLPGRKYTVVFCTPRRAALLGALIETGKYQMVSSRDIGLPLGVTALAVKRRALPKGIPFQTGGGTTAIMSPDWVIWAEGPDRFEAGTPAIINVIAFARALKLVKQYGNGIFRDPAAAKLSVSEILYSDTLEKYSGQNLLEELMKTLIGRGMPVPTTEGNRPFINFDNSASTPAFEPVWEAVRRTWRQPSEVQQEMVQEVRTVCAAFLGVFTNLAEISRIVHQHGARLLVDAAQMAAHRTISMAEWGIDFLAFSAHKMYAPFGCGALVFKKGLLNFSSGEMDLIRSSGEENRVGIAALGKTLVLLQRIGMDLIRKEEQTLTAHLLRGLSQVEGLRIFGISDPDSPAFAGKGGVVVFELKGFMSSKLAKELAVHGGIGVRYGCHCAHLLIKHLVGVPHKLEWIQAVIAKLFPRVKFPGLLRVSLGIGNSEQEVDELIRVLNKISIKPQARDSRYAASKEDALHQIKDFTKSAAQRVYSVPD